MMTLITRVVGAASLALASAVVAEEPGAAVDRAAPSRAPELGHWRATLDLEGHELPFDLVLEREDGDLAATIVNAEERIRVAEVGLEGATLTLGFPHYDSTIRAAVDPGGKRLRGVWTKKRRYDEPIARIPFIATHGEGPRFELAEGSSAERTSEGVALAKRWRVHFESSDEAAVGVFEPAPGDPRTVHGTFLTTTGDYRYLEGVFDGAELRLSCFDGAHAFLFEASLGRDGTLLGRFHSGDWWDEAWHARPDADAALPDAFSLTRVEREADLDALVYPDLGGEPTRVSALVEGSPALVQITASWCPNCADASKYLAELHERYADRGLRIVALSFEHTPDLERSIRQVRRARARAGAHYPVLIAGLSDKAKASEAVPVLDRVRSFPTTLFVDRDGSIVSVHQGFSGPATGGAHERLRRAFESRIERLLAE